MAHKVLHGVHHGRLKGPTHGGLPLGISVTKDGPSGVYTPLSAADFATLGIAAPTNLWLCQEASGNLADSIGSATLVANAAPAYQQTISGWTRKAVTLTEATAGQRFQCAGGVGPNAGTSSVAWLIYMSTPTTPASPRQLLDCEDTASPLKASINTLNKWNINCAGVTTAGTVNMNNATVHPMLVVYDRTNTLVRVFTDSEQINGTYSAAVTDGAKGFGATSGSAATQNILWCAAWTGANAETIGKATLQTLAWTLSY